MTGEQVELRSPLPEDLRVALIRSADGAIPLDHPDPLDFLGFYSI